MKLLRAVLWLPVLTILAAFCVVSALDREVAAERRFGRTPVILSIGPRSDQQRAIASLARHDRTAAVRYARSAIDQAPMDPGNLSLFAVLMAATGRPELTREAMAAAAALGWRDPVTQTYWLDDARRTSNFVNAAERADALLRVDPAREKARDMLVDLEAVPPGREAVAERLSGNPPWIRGYLGDLPAFPADIAMERVRTLIIASRGTMRSDCEQTGAAAQGMIDKGTVVPAAALWYGLCEHGVTPTRVIGDSGFDRIGRDQALSPFRWRLFPTGSIDVSVEPAPSPTHGNALVFHSTSSADEPIARYTLLLTPGHYRTTWVERDSGSGNPASASLSLACIGGTGRIMSEPGASANLETRVWMFVVPAGCAAQKLTLLAPPSGNGAIDDVVVTPIT